MKQVFVTTAFAIASAALVFGCASETTGPSSETGTVSVNLLVGDNDVTAVNFEVTCSDSTVCPLNGQFNVIDRGPNEPPIWATIMDLPVGVPDPIVYTIILTALDDQQEVLCTSGPEEFTVNALEPTKVNVVLACGGDGEELLGSVDIDATFVVVDGNRCPRLHFLNAVPIDVPAEGSEVTVLVSDADEDPLTTALTTPGGGSFADPAAQSTTYFCDNASGAQTISVTVSDGDEACNKSKSFDVTCPGDNNLCEGKDCDAGNVCVAAECNEATGDCGTSNVGSGVGCALGELTTNGGFELGNTDFWTFFDNGGTFDVTTEEANGGQYSGKLVAPGPATSPLIKQANLAIGVVTENSPITISFDLKGELTGISGQVVAELISEIVPAGGTNEILGILTPTSEWATYSFATTTGADVSNGVTLQLKAECGAVVGCATTAYFDNVSVVFGSGAGTCDGQGTCVPSAAVCENPITDCPPTNNECVDPVCTAGVCDTSNNTNACTIDGGAGTCNAGVCVPDQQTCLYEQDFESFTLPPPGGTDFPPNSLSEDGWLVGGNNFESDGTTFVDNYFAFPAPNGGPAFSAVVEGEGGTAQGAQQMSIYNDYNNPNHNDGDPDLNRIIEAVVFQERLVVAADVGKTISFTFDAKKGNIAPPTTAEAFLQVLKSSDSSFAQLVRVTEDTTDLPDAWGTFTISVVIDASWVGETLQFGAQSRAANFEPSGVFYDNMAVCSQ